ncbi:filamentous hemagglutinin N-terminal domain-containing protein [Pseudomonas sp. SLFW]|nr:DUF637 domain-containing protein [Pseudomonas sp. SLFW]NBB12037.1 filamentous hemagglutinin N-terminal domain-containing protein [Pseudomonas sp. SLFW]
MDFRHLLFLARQPSAALTPRDRFCGLPKRGLALVLANALFWQPLWAQAQGIVGGPGQQQAGNGVPIVNIAAPNAQGLSHNQFQDYNVGPEGLILNNATGPIQSTQLGGQILGNPNLRGQAAGVILNEVTGSHPSQLRGATEIAGQAAHVIVANPHGITCSGCGFINTPRATLTTGKPVIEGGTVGRFQVEQGEVAVDGAGLDATAVDRFDIIARSVKINAQINARELNVVAGRNRVDAQSLDAQTLPDDGSEKPQVAIDSSALGGMYANTIRLVGTEAGVGVRLAGDVAASAGDLHLDVNGHLTLANASAASAIRVQAQDVALEGERVNAPIVEIRSAGEVTNRSTLTARDRIAITAQKLKNESDIRATDVAVNIKTLTNRKTLAAERTLTINAERIDNQGGTLRGQQIGVVSRDRLDNRGGVIAGSQVSVSTALLDNGRLGEAAGQLTSLVDDLVLSVDTLLNQAGSIFAKGAVRFEGSTFDNREGQVAGGSLDLKVGEHLLNQRGILEANDDFSLRAAALDNGGGMINGLGNSHLALGSVTALGAVQFAGSSRFDVERDLTLNAGERLFSGSGLALSAARLNNAGEILSDGDLNLAFLGDLRNSGLIQTLQRLTLSAGDLQQTSGRLASAGDATLTLSGLLNNLGVRTASESLRINAAQIDNHGTLGAQGAVTLQAQTGIANHADSLLFSGGDMALFGPRVSNLYGDVYSQGDLHFSGLDGGFAEAFSNRSGTVESEGNLSLKARRVENAKAEFELGRERVAGDLDWVCGQHCGGHDSFKRGLITILQTWIERAIKDSASARLVAGQSMNIEADRVENRYSLMAANADLTITAQHLLNLGASARIGENITQIGTPGQIDTAYWDQMEFIDIPAFKAALAAGNFDLAWFELLKARSGDDRFEELSNVTEWRDSGETYAATLQSGGKMTLNVARSVQNGTVRENTLAQLTGQVGDDALGAVDIDLSKRVADGDVLNAAGFDPTSASGFRLPQGDYGLFIKSQDPSARYLVERNPNLTDLAQFLGSDYLLGLLGYSADGAWRRLGDGFYESRLIRDAVVARTGQRFLSDDLTSDEAQFRYLMNNAAASQEALKLSVGVGLSAEQVAALTTDIVWMENRVVDGQTVLVPVLYLADAEKRNVRGNALIQGRDVELLSGGDLLNTGTLRGQENLAASAGGSLYQSGLVEAGKHLTLLAQDSIRNAMAGIILGSDVSLLAISGDIVNDRTAIQVRDGAGIRTIIDGPGVIEANAGLSLIAGQDISNRGAIKAGTDASLHAGRDINLLATVSARERHDLADGGHRYTVRTDIENLASTLQSGGHLNLTAGRDINVVASQANAANDLSLSAGRDITVASVADVHSLETRSKDGHTRITERDERQTQVGSVLLAGQDVRSTAARDTTLMASQIEAGRDVQIHSGGRLDLIAAQNSTSTLYDMQENGGWGAKKSQRDEVTNVTHVGSGIKAGGNLSLVSGGDQRYQQATLDAGGNLTLDSGGAVTFEAVKDLQQESHAKSKSDLAWFSMKGEGRTDETLRQSELIAKGAVVINAVQGLKIDVQHVDRQTVGQTIDAMVAADPQLAWLKAAEARGDVDWRQVAEIHESFKYDNSGLGPAAQIAIAILMAWAVGPAAFAAVAEAGAAASVAAAAGAIATSASTTAAVSAVNNRGNLGAVFKDVTSSDSLKNYAVAGVTAGLTSGLFNEWTGTHTDPVTGKVTGPALNTWQGISQFAANQSLQNVTSAALAKALGQGGNVSDGLKSALFNTLAAASFNLVGDYTTGTLETGSASKIAIHAMVGGLLAKATGGDFKTGALAAGANEALVGHLDGLVQGNEALLTLSSQMIGLLAAAAQKDTDAEKLQQGVWVAKNATEYNYLLHKDLEAMRGELATSKTDAEKRQIHEKYAQQNEDKNAALANLCKTSPDTCRQISAQLEADDPKLQALAKELYAQGEIKEGTLIAAFFQQENLTARLEIASELGAIKNGEGSRFWNELGAVMLGAGGGSSTAKPATTTPSRPSHQQSEKDVGRDPGPDARPQMSYKNEQGVSDGGKENSVAADFFAGTKYTNKVLAQIKTGDLHAFPESVKTFQTAGQITKITGGDGVVRDRLQIPGEYRGKQGVFEFIKEPDGAINHRLFKPNRESR